jgi:hypothetical protein
MKTKTIFIILMCRSLPILMRFDTWTGLPDPLSTRERVLVKLTNTQQYVMSLQFIINRDIS